MIVICDLTDCDRMIIPNNIKDLFGIFTLIKSLSKKSYNKKNKNYKNKRLKFLFLQI